MYAGAGGVSLALAADITVLGKHTNLNLVQKAKGLGLPGMYLQVGVPMRVCV
jgi:enoyl-CoA hydratase/carnithine racemase